MKERPILFSGPMVRALLDESKTQTRRVVPDRILDKYADYDDWCNAVMPSDIPCSRVYEKESFREQCKYGFPGDRLWVRETFAVFGDDEQYVLHYRADINRGSGWKPSIFMPRKYSRILLEITDVRVERLQDISEQDAIAEGVEPNCSKRDHSQCTAEDHDEFIHYGRLPDDYPAFSAKESFQSLWASINGADSWNANPWVWVIEFKRVQP